MKRVPIRGTDFPSIARRFFCCFFLSDKRLGGPPPIGRSPVSLSDDLSSPGCRPRDTWDRVSESDIGLFLFDFISTFFIFFLTNTLPSDAISSRGQKELVLFFTQRISTWAAPWAGQRWRTRGMLHADFAISLKNIGQTRFTNKC